MTTDAVILKLLDEYYADSDELMVDPNIFRLLKKAYELGKNAVHKKTTPKKDER